MDHATAHRDRVLEDFISNAELLEGVDATGGEGEIDRASADDVAFAGIGPAFVKIDLVTTPAEKGAEQSSRQSAADKGKFGSHVRFTVAVSADLPSAHR